MKRDFNKEKNMKFQVEEVKDHFIVRDTESGKSITQLIPDREIAQGIADDFNAMNNKDYRPIGGPDARIN